MISHPLQIIDHMKQRTDQTGIRFEQIERVDFDQIAGDVVVEIVDNLLVLLDLLMNRGIRLKKILHGQSKIVPGNLRHPFDLFHHLGDRDGGSTQNPLVQIVQPHLFKFRILAGHQFFRQPNQ